MEKESDLTTNRMLNNLRKNPDYIAVTGWLDEQGIEWELCRPRGRGHPYLQIGKVRFPLASSPKARQRKKQCIGSLKQRLREARSFDG